VLNSIVSYEESEQVQQANVFKRQRLTFQFSTYRPNRFDHLSHHTPVRVCETIDCCNRCIGRRNNTTTRSFLINNTFVTMSVSKLFTPSTYCWSRKTLVTIHWTHLRLTGICATWLMSTENKQHNAAHYGILLAATLPYLMFINDVTVTSSK